MRKAILFLFILLTCYIPITKAQVVQLPAHIELSDKAEISLLTSTPWDGVVYALFGHTAIRVSDTIQINLDEYGLRPRNFDFVFNYGLFSFNTPNFEFRFVKGETDYSVGAVPFPYYLAEYQEREVGVIEQVLNLTQKEKQDILNALLINALPENRIYRYNFFYDNCATRPRDIIEKYIDGTIEYTPTNKEQSYRDLVHECVSIEPWTRFGIDLVIGADADKTITDRQKDFLPLYLMRAYEGAKIKNDSIEKPLLRTTHDILTASPKQSHYMKQVDNSIIDEPLITGCILLVFTILFSILVYKKGWFTIGKLFDTLLFLVAGAAGCVIFFLMFFSEHPCTNPNWNIMWLNPLQLIVAFLFFVKSLSKYIYYYHFINFASLLLFLLAWCLIPLRIEIAFIPYILAIAIRSVMNIIQQQKLKKKADYSLPKAK